jgi:hypothetical protein
LRLANRSLTGGTGVSPVLFLGQEIQAVTGQLLGFNKKNGAGFSIGALLSSFRGIAWNVPRGVVRDILLKINKLRDFVQFSF